VQLALKFPGDPGLTPTHAFAESPSHVLGGVEQEPDVGYPPKHAATISLIGLHVFP